MNKFFIISLIVILGFGFGYGIAPYHQLSIGQSSNGQNNTQIDNFSIIEKNGFSISKPIYQTITGEFLNTKQLSTTPTLVTEEYFIEHALMKDIGNVTNIMTFINIYDNQSAVIQGRGNGTIQTQDNQTIRWISSDLGIPDESGLTFHGVIFFNKTNGEKLSFLNGKIGIYEDDPKLHRTIWLIN